MADCRTPLVAAAISGSRQQWTSAATGVYKSWKLFRVIPARVLGIGRAAQGPHNAPPAVVRTARLLEQLGWLERVPADASLIGSDVLRNSVGGMGAIYTEAVVTEHDIGEHSSIADAYRWFAAEAYAEPAVPALSEQETEETPHSTP